jgi:hypothetical protein
MTRIGDAVTGCILLLIPSFSLAQSGKPVSAQASFLYVGLSGSAYEGLQAGLGAEGQIRYNFPSPLSIGGGLQYSRHEFDEASGITDPLTLVGAFVEPRYVIRTGSDVLFPYLSGRLAYLKQSTKVSGATVSATGTQFNGGGGVLYGLTNNLLLDLGATFGAVSFGSFSGGGGKAGSGTNVVFRVGVSGGIGG